MKEIRAFKINDLIIIDDRVYKILEINRSKPGKHGEAKARMMCQDVFGSSGSKTSIVKPVKHKQKAPIIERRSGTILSADPEKGEMQIIDMDSYEQSIVGYDPEEFKITPDKSQVVTYMQWGEYRKAMAVRASQD